MSDDPTRPLPGGWPQQPDPRSRPGGNGGYGNEPGRQSGPGGWGAPGGQSSQGGWGSRGEQSGQGGWNEQRGQGDQRGQSGWSAPAGPGEWGGQRGPQGLGGQRGPRGLGGPQGQGNWSEPGGGRTARPQRRHRGLKVTAIVVVVLLILAVVVDRVANRIAEHEAASQIQSAGFPVKPKVAIDGFPFLTQLAARDFKQVDISASNVKEGVLTIASVNATMHGVHITSGFNGATVDQINGTALVSFTGLGSAAGIGDSMTLSNGGNNQLKATINLGFISGSALAQVKRTGPHQIQVTVTSAGEIPLSALGNLRQFTINLPSLPAGMTVQSVGVTNEGVLISISGSHTTFSG
jgi:hypothetical protein